MIRKYAEFFGWKNVSRHTFFSAKNIRILSIESAKTVNEITLNELVKLTTLWITGSWSIGTERKEMGKERPTPTCFERRNVNILKEDHAYKRRKGWYRRDGSFVCHYWQWPILIKCVKCYCLCVLRRLMRPILALNCLLQIEQERSEKESSVGDALALAFRCARFCLASLILFASYSSAHFLMRPRHLARSCAICSHDSVSMLKSLREA